MTGHPVNVFSDMFKSYTVHCAVWPFSPAMYYLLGMCQTV